MDRVALFLIELGAVVFCLGLLARLAGRIGMSPIPLYLVGGLCFGAGGVVELSGMKEFSHLAGEIGVILLLLMLGLEYTATELVTGLRRSWKAGILDFVLNFVPGAALAAFLGWGVVGAMVMGGVTYISSSGIAAKVITDLGRIGNRETPVVLSILVFEDLAMAIYLPILTATLAGVSFLGGLQTVGVSLAVVTVVLLVALKARAPRLQSRAQRKFGGIPAEPARGRLAGLGCGGGAAGVRRGGRLHARHRHLRRHSPQCDAYP